MGPALALRLPPTVVLADLTVRTPTSSHPPTLPRAVRPSRWPTLELRLYSLAVGLGLGSILWTAVQLGYGQSNLSQSRRRGRRSSQPGRNAVKLTSSPRSPLQDIQTMSSTPTDSVKAGYQGVRSCSPFLACILSRGDFD